MVCGACLAAPLAIIGLGTTSVNTTFGLLLTILSCAIFLYYKQLKICNQCI